MNIKLPDILTAPIRGKSSEATTKRHTTPEASAVQGFQKIFYDLAKTSRKTAIYGQVFKQKESETLILSSII
ncbi:hypothetical protein H6F93_00070 [Leptolyngbya sp. FACHB-671]|nr:hypothetical protein [Leptolyngbya sp. FACHB-671]